MMPRNPPVIESVVASTRNCHKILLPVAPRALRIPISHVRWYVVPLGAPEDMWPSGKALSVKEISIDGNRVRVAGESTGGTAVESYRAALSSALGAGFTVTVQESRGSARGENVSFTILIEKGTADHAS